MKIVVAIKQVPERDAQVRIDAAGKWIDDSGLQYALNEPDAYALEEALQLREQHGGEVVVLSAGPERVGATLREALAKGGKAAALKVLGIDMREGIEELSKSYQEPTAEDIARRVASEEFDSRQKAEQARQEAAQREASERAQAADAASSADFVHRANTLCVADDVAYAHVIAHEVTGAQLWQFTKALQGKLGRSVTPEEALTEAEKILEEKDNQARAKKAAKETAAAEAEKAKKPAEKKASDAKPPEKSAPAKQAQERKNASQRAAEAMRRLNIS